MNKEQIKGNWNQLKGKVKEHWGDLTDDDLTRIDGEYDQLIGQVQEKYGKSKEEVQREVDNFFEEQ